MNKALFAVLWLAGSATAADLSNPVNFMFVADASEKIIDVVDLRDLTVVHRFETSLRADDLTVTPYAPILIYSNTDNNAVVFIDLRDKKEQKKIVLPFTPRHLVMDTTGAKIGVTDSEDGGFALLSAYTQAAQFILEDFPPTGDVLFDPNEVDVYYSNPGTGSLGLLDTNLRQTFEMSLTDDPNEQLSSPSRSLDSRYIYVANESNGDIYSLNAYSKIIYRTFNVGQTPARPYSTPEGAFLYLMDRQSGRLLAIDQYEFEEYVDVTLDHGTDLVTVGRFDRFNLFLSTTHRNFTLFDNAERSVVGRGSFIAVPLNAFGSVDGKSAYVAFVDTPKIAIYDLENRELMYVDVTENGAGAFVVGLTNNVCH